jgi:4'-phosphopantetheinyl transferase
MVANLVDLWIARPAKVNEPEHLAACVAVLDSDERARFKRFRFDEDRRSYLVAHVLLREALSDRVRMPLAAWRFTRAAAGRPRVAAGGPVSPTFSVSHERNLVACLVARAGDHGIDVEALSAGDARLDGVELVLSDTERATVRREGARGSVRAIELWTLKEAYAKARGLGLSLDLRPVTFRLDHRTIRVSFEPPAFDDPDRWWFALYAPTPEHRLAIALDLAVDGRMTVNHPRFRTPLAGFGGAAPLVPIATSAAVLPSGRSKPDPVLEENAVHL